MHVTNITCDFGYGREVKYDCKEEHENRDCEISPLDSAEILGADMGEEHSAS